MPYSNPDDAYGPPCSVPFQGETLGANIAFEWQYTVGNELKPQVTSSATKFAGITTARGNRGILATPHLPVPISATVGAVASITIGKYYNFETTNGRVSHLTEHATTGAVRAMQTYFNATGSIINVVLYFEIISS